MDAVRISQLINVDVVDRLLDILLLIGLDGQVLDANAAALACYGYRHDEIVRLSIQDIRAPGDRDVIASQMQAALAGGAHFDAVHRRRDGTEFPVEIRSARVVVGEETALLSIVTDVTGQRHEEALSAARVRVAEYSAAHSLDETIQCALDEAEALTDSKIAFFHFVDDDQLSLRLQTWSTNTLATQCTASGKGSHYPVEDAGVWAECLRELRPVIHNDYASLSAKKGLPEGHAPVVRELTVPVIREGRVKIIVGVGNKPTDYDEEDLATVVRLADLTFDLVLVKRTEQELQDSEQRYRSLVSALSEGVLLQDENGSILTWNKAAADIFGIGAEEALGQTSTSRDWGVLRDDGTPLPGDEHPSMITLRTGRPCHGVALKVRGPLGVRMIEINTQPLFRPQQELPFAVVVSFSDITDRKSAVDVLEESVRWLNESQSVAKLGHYVYEIQKDEWTGSPALYEVLGVDPEASHDLSSWMEAVHPLDRERMRTYFLEEVLEQRRPFDMEYRVNRPSADGDSWVHGLGHVEYAEDGQPLSMFGVIQDVTERRHAEDAVVRTQVLLASCLESQRDTILMSVDMEYRYLYFNQAHAASMKLVYGVDVALGDCVLDRITDEADRATAKENYDRALNGESHSNMRIYGEKVHVVYESFFNPLVDESGTIIGATAMARDVTERVNAEAQLAEAQNDLERSNKELEQFAYVASHDLQEPLRMVSSYLQLIRKRYAGALDSDADEFIDFAVDGAERMQRLLEDLLAYSRVGTQGTPPTAVDSGAAAHLAISNLRERIREDGAEVVVGDLPMVMADEVQLMRLFQNLIGNGVKFHREGVAPRVEIAATRDAELWRFCVTDNGMGIPAGSFDEVFEVFRRLSSAERSGTGIGLAVCRRIVERHGGTIWVESSSATGTTFCFTLPIVQEM